MTSKKKGGKYRRGKGHDAKIPERDYDRWIGRRNVIDKYRKLGVKSGI